MLDLTKIRLEIDEIDAQIVELYEKRMQVCKEVAAFKIANDKPVFDKEREAQKIAKVKELAKEVDNKQGIEELFEQLMSMSRKMQYKLIEQANINKNDIFEVVDQITTQNKKVVYQGDRGAYSHLATIQYFGEDVEAYKVDTFRGALEEVRDGKASFAILPLENSTAGMVEGIFDLLIEFDLYIIGEQIIPINHCLLGVEGSKKEEIKTIYSHPQSLMQTMNYLKKMNIEQIGMENNAYAAKKVANDGLTSQAAIASSLAASEYGLKILEKDIQDLKGNSTKFIIVSKQKICKNDANTISICFELPDERGSLYHILAHFIYNGLNLSKIESLPINNQNWGYRFFVNFEGNFRDSAVKNVLHGIKDEARNVKVLGNF